MKTMCQIKVVINIFFKFNVLKCSKLPKMCYRVWFKEIQTTCVDDIREIKK